MGAVAKTSDKILSIEPAAGGRVLFECADGPEADGWRVDILRLVGEDQREAERLAERQKAIDGAISNLSTGHFDNATAWCEWGLGPTIAPGDLELQALMKRVADAKAKKAAADMKAKKAADDATERARLERARREEAARRQAKADAAERARQEHLERTRREAALPSSGVEQPPPVFTTCKRC